MAKRALAGLSRFHQLLANAAETYKRALIGHQPGLTWDYVVLTAANEHQAAGYRHEIALRQGGGYGGADSGGGPLGPFFPPSQQTIVVPDPPGFRAGSGGATLGVLRAIAEHQKHSGAKHHKPFDTLRVLLIHSGGASQRLPLYSPLGKIFTPLPLMRPDGQLMTLFDHLYLQMAALPPRLGPGMLVAAGDVFLLFEGTAVPTPPAGVTALSIRTSAVMGQTHGVFKIDNRRRERDGTGGEFPLVTATMQKATIADMRSAGVTDAAGTVLIDSGLLFFDPAATMALYDLSQRYSSAWHIKTRRQIDLYADIAPAALAAHQPLLSGDPMERNLQRDLRRSLRGSPLRCYELPAASFQHIGTSRQFRDALTGIDPAPACALFHQNVRFASESKLPDSARVYQSVISTAKVKVGKNVVIENCHLAASLEVGEGSILSNLRFRSPLAGFAIPPETVVYSTPIQTRERGGVGASVTIILGIHDDPKTDRTLCNVDLRHWLALAGIGADDLWDKREKSRVLWKARLFPAIERRPKGKPVTEHPLEGVSWFMRPQTLTSARRAAWRAAKRYSMADVLELADAAAMAAHRDALSGMLQATQWIDAVAAGTASSVQNTINHFGPAGYRNLTGQLYAAARDTASPALVRARLGWSLAEIEARPNLPAENSLPATVRELQQQAFECIREAMEVPAASLKRREVRFKEQGAMGASAPVRLDFAGGWTDTPPYCLENGGAVLNVAINLNDVEPIRTTFRPLEEPIVRLISRDLGKTLVVRDPGQLTRPPAADNPFALHMAAMRLTGVAPGAKETLQKKWLSRLGLRGRRGAGGFELATASNLPKGSGMGTSSILGATALAVLRAAIGLDTAPASLCEQTLLLEQHLGTGGGWQDQVGGIVGGAKMTQTSPGIPQKLRVRRIHLSAAQIRGLEERLVVYFTGQQRLARNILREVMGRYLSREPGTIVLFNELVHAAVACEQALRKSDWLSCAAEINHYWRIKKDLFPGSTTPTVDGLFLEMRPYYLAGCLAGAGGGGFAFFLCRDGDQAHRLRTELARLSSRPGSLGLSFAAGINMAGLRVKRV